MIRPRLLCPPTGTLSSNWESAADAGSLIAMASKNSSETILADSVLIDRIREGDADAWGSFIAKFEGRLLAFTKSRIRDHAASEDIVQETFVGFLVSLPNYDGSRPLESYLFTICAYKLTDHLRREGRRPSIQMHGRGSSAGGDIEPIGGDRVASSIARSGVCCAATAAPSR